MELIIATKENIEELVEMNNQLVEDEQFDKRLTQENKLLRMADFISGNTYDCYLIKNENINYGYCLLDKTKDPIYLRHLFIKREYRGKGFGKETIQKLLRKYKSKRIDIEVMAWNHNAIKFYEKLGFKMRFHGMRLTEE